MLRLQQRLKRSRCKWGVLNKACVSLHFKKTRLLFVTSNIKVASSVMLGEGRPLAVGGGGGTLSTRQTGFLIYLTGTVRVVVVTQRLRLDVTASKQTKTRVGRLVSRAAVDGYAAGIGCIERAEWQQQQKRGPQSSGNWD